MNREDEIQEALRVQVDSNVKALLDPNDDLFEQGFQRGARWATMDMIDKAIEFFEKDLWMKRYKDGYLVCSDLSQSIEEFIENFKKFVKYGKYDND
jgi:hypothetical protein